MRTRDEIISKVEGMRYETNPRNKRFAMRDSQMIIELLLDIRDLLAKET